MCGEKGKWASIQFKWSRCKQCWIAQLCLWHYEYGPRQFFVVGNKLSIYVSKFNKCHHQSKSIWNNNCCISFHQINIFDCSDRNGQEVSGKHFHRVFAKDKATHTYAQNNLSKGDRVLVHGRISYKAYMFDGEEKNTGFISADKIFKIAHRADPMKHMESNKIVGIRWLIDTNQFILILRYFRLLGCFSVILIKNKFKFENRP